MTINYVKLHAEPTEGKTLDISKYIREKMGTIDPVILYQTKRFRFQDQKFMLKYKLSIPSRNLCQVL